MVYLPLQILTCYCKSLIFNRNLKGLVYLFIFISGFCLGIQANAQKQDTLKTSTVLKKGEVSKDSIEKAKPKAIETTIDYTAEDSIVFNAETKTAKLYQGAHLTYGSRDIKAASVEINYDIQTITAKYKLDTTGKKVGIPDFKEGNDHYVAEEIKYNYKTRKGLVKELVTQQGEGYIHGELVKKDPQNFMYVRDAIYTTCNLKHPHFYIKTSKLKMIPNKKIVTGPFHLRIADIPTPLAFFFGYFPIPKRRSSGFIVPMYGESRDRGFFFRGGGYYFAINDYMGLRALVDLYTVGGWGTQLLFDYKKRYAFSGDLNLRYNYFVSNPEDEKLKSIRRDLWITWRHTPDSKGKTYQFSANVNAGTSTYNTNASFNIQQRQTANFTSSVNFSKYFRNNPFSFGASARVDQNVATGTMNFDLPTLNISMNRQYLFKDIQAPRAIREPLRKLSFSYNGSLINRISNVNTNTYNYNLVAPDGSIVTNTNSYFQPDTVYFFKKDATYDFGTSMNKFLSNARYGVQHSIPITTTAKLFKYFSLNPSLNYSEYWYQKQYQYEDWTPTRKGVKVDTTSFGRAYAYNLSANMTTRVYGTFFVRKGALEAIRHTFIPTVGFTYVPDLSNQSVQRVRTDSVNYRDLNKYDNGVIGGPSNLRRESRNLTFSLSNTFEMKVKNTKDTADKKPFKKINLLDNVNLSGAYDLSADSFALSRLNFTARTRVLNRLDINFLSTIDPYAYQEIGTSTTSGEEVFKRGKQLAIAKGQGIGKVTSWNLALSTSFRPKAKKKAPQVIVDPWELQYIRQNNIRYIDWNTPWNLSFSYIATYSNYGGTTFKGVNAIESVKTFRQSLSANGDISMTDKWKVNGSTTFDFFTKSFSTTRIGIVRDLHCWDVSFNWVPFGPYQSYTVDLAVKAAALRDLKLSRNRSWYDN